MPSLYASQALTWLTTSPAAKRKFGSYFVSKPTPGSLLGVRHPKDINAVVPLEGETPFVLAAVLWAANSGTFKNNMWAGPKDPQWPCPEANCAEFDLAAGPGLSKNEILRVWARRLALQIKLDTDAVFPWKIADLSVDEFKMLFSFRPWMFSSAVPTSGILSSSARKEIVELPRQTEQQLRFVATTSVASNGCSPDATIVKRDRSSHSFWGFKNGRFDFGQIWDSNPLITYSLAIASSTNHLLESKKHPVGHPHILGIRCVTRLIQERDPVHPDLAPYTANSVVNPGHGNLVPLESARKNVCTIPSFRVSHSYPVRAYYSKPVTGCMTSAYLLTSILRACNIPCYPIASRLSANMPTQPYPQASSCGLRKLVGEKLDEAVISCLSVPSSINFAVRWYEDVSMSAEFAEPIQGDWSPCGPANNHHSVFCSSVGLQLCHADLLLGWGGTRYLDRAEDVWIGLAESLTIEVLFHIAATNGLYDTNNSNGSLRIIESTIKGILEVQFRKFAINATLGFCTNALEWLPSYHQYIVSRLQIWAYVHANALAGGLASTSLDLSYLRFYLDAPTEWGSSGDCVLPHLDVGKGPSLSARGKDSGYAFFPRNYVTSKCILGGTVWPEPPFCKNMDDEDGPVYTDSDGYTVGSETAYTAIWTSVISRDKIARIAIDRFAYAILAHLGNLK